MEKELMKYTQSSTTTWFSRKLVGTLGIALTTLLCYAGCSNDNQTVTPQNVEENRSVNNSSKGSGQIQSCADDQYSSYIQISTSNYDVESRNKLFSSVLFATIHGGSIEPGTTEIADGCASTNYDYYSFTGTLSSNGNSLHICSDNFDEPVGIARINAASKAIVLHGASNPASGSTKIAWVGGLDVALRNEVIDNLIAQGFDARIPAAGSGLTGTSVNNYTNKTSTGQGCQIEMTKDLRKSFFVNGLLTAEGRKHKTNEFTKFVTALRNSVMLDKN